MTNPTPTQIATQAAEAILSPIAPSRSIERRLEGQTIEGDNDYPKRLEAITALILSAAAKMVRESGAVEALDSAQLGCRLDQRILLQNREKLAAQCAAALEKLRSISEEEAGKSPGDPGSAPAALRRLVIATIGGEPLFDGAHDGAPYVRDREIHCAGSRWRIVSTTDGPHFQTVIVSRS